MTSNCQKIRKYPSSIANIKKNVITIYIKKIL